jgi:dienelactone hydrolase
VTALTTSPCPDPRSRTRPLGAEEKRRPPQSLMQFDVTTRFPGSMAVHRASQPYQWAGEPFAHGVLSLSRSSSAHRSARGFLHTGKVELSLISLQRSFKEGSVTHLARTWVVFGCFLASWTSTHGEEAVGEGKQFDYDRAAPLQIEQVSSKTRDGITVQDLSYAGADGGRVPAYLVIPPGNGPFAAVLWGHWMMPGSAYMNRTEFLEEATALARSGVVSLLLDAPMVRPGSQPKGDVESYQKGFRQDVIDLRRGIDLLLARKDVDAKRFAYIGHSFHAATGGVLAGIDPRVSAFVLMAGGMDSARVLVSRSAYAEDMRKKMGEAELNKFVATSGWMNPATYLGQRKHGPLLLQFGTHDLFMTKEDCDEYASVVSAP